MKRILSVLLVPLSITILLNSCAGQKQSQGQRKEGQYNAREPGQGCFVKLKDGNSIHFKSLRMVTGILKTPHLLADGKIKIFANQLTAYQSDTHYAVSQDVFTAGQKSLVAVEALPGFAVRTTRGQLNVYCKKYFNGKNTVDEFYLQAGNDGRIVPYSCELLNDLLKENITAVHFFNSSDEKKRMPEKIKIAVQLYNQGTSITKN